ncbi:YdaS family helix-turn-helix protein [Methylocaldum gracile]|jgi:DNA-binding transcriptional regulator YdaS (Cro superfamily)|uniref:YdaS family helix-turn-helix protein n=1 Tax=Methylocaldum sp. 0917 TaxID=2485163 RepID=UPI00105E68FC
MNGLLKAISIAGSQVKLAQILGGNVKQQHISYWLRNGVSAERAIEIEKALSNKVRRSDLRPDLWPSDEAA